ncbi:MAG: aspartate--tRNA ligase [Erysipelotrichaceae bacterium]
MKRTHKNNELNKSHVGQEVTLVGWVNKRRNLGSICFIDLRDRYGLTQITMDESFHESMKDVRNEFVLQVTGTVALRKDANPKLLTGEIEVLASEVIIVNKSQTTPMIIADETDALEDVRLKYRYLDIRREPIKNNLILRHKVAMIVRNYLSNLDFIEVETPILSKSTPEGARDYLVPSRIYKGSFYALPQSPQIYKQLLMIGGLERYFQLGRCFRDEDLRADRQPEFTQIDIEMSFVEEEDVFAVVEGLMKDIFSKIKDVELAPFKRLPYKECMARYGSDKPDIRFDLELNDVTDIFKNTEFAVFKSIIEANGIVNAIVVKGAASKYSRKDLDKLQEFVRVYRAKALSYLKMSDNELSGSIFKVLSEQEKNGLITELKIENDDLVLMVADQSKVVYQALGALRNKIAKDLELIDPTRDAFLWVTDFPMFDYDEKEDRYVACHHPFTAPNKEDEDKLFENQDQCYSRAYDLVLNGYELLSGSIRIYDEELQAKVFKAIGLTPEQADAKFGFFLEAFKYGAPPHGGVGIGLERLIMILADTDNIKDVVAFPKTASASCLMADAPSEVAGTQLDELALILNCQD